QTDAIGSQGIGKLDQPFQVGKIAHAPVAYRANAVELHRQYPAAVEIAVKGPPRCNDQGDLLRTGGIGQMQPVSSDRQILRPGDEGIMALAVSDNLKIGHNFPSQWERDSLRQIGSCGLAAADHYRTADQAVRCQGRQSVNNDL